MIVLRGKLVVDVTVVVADLAQSERCRRNLRPVRLHYVRTQPTIDRVVGLNDVPRRWCVFKRGTTSRMRYIVVWMIFL